MNEFLEVLNLNVQGTSLTGAALWIALIALGAGIGILTGLFGVGGGFLTVPLLNILLGIPYETAIGSSLCFILGTSTAGLPAHIRKGNFEMRCMLMLAAAGMIGAVLGDMLQDVLIYNVAGGDRATFQKLMHGLFIILLLATAWTVYRDPKTHASGRTPLQRLPLPPRVDLPAAGLTGLSVPGMAAIGLGVGVTTGVFGIGGGVLFMPILLLVVGLSAHQAVGTSLGVVLLAAFAGTIKKGYAGKVSLTIAMALLVGSAIGVQIGVILCNRLEAKRLRRSFAGIVLLAALLLVLDLAKKLIVDS